MLTHHGHKRVESEIFLESFIELLLHFLVAKDHIFEGGFSEGEIFGLLAFEVLFELIEDWFNDRRVIWNVGHFRYDFI
jgi:hypothetical protein